MKIFISIASYCDELLFFTINSCIEKAKEPQNIVFAIVDQNEEYLLQIDSHTLFEENWNESLIEQHTSSL